MSRQFRFYVTLTVGIATVAVYGCGVPASPHVRPLSRASAQKSAAAPALSAVASVQATPEYAKAKAECRDGRYRQAADILARLERSPSISGEQREFCRRQELICLGHLGRRGETSLVPNSGGVRARIGLGGRNGVAPQPPNSGGLVARTGPASPTGDADCGPRALLLACERLGVKASLPELRHAAGTSASGTTMAGLKSAAEGLHLKAEGIQAGREALAKISTPALGWCHGDHWIAVLSLKGEGENGTAVIHDPNEAAERTIAQERLLQMSGGYLLTLRR